MITNTPTPFPNVAETDMNTLPQPITLKSAEIKALQEMQAETEAYQRIQEQLLNQLRLKMRKIQSIGQETYRAIADRTGIDIQRVQWAPNFETGQLIPIAVTLLAPGDEYKGG